MCYTLGTIQNNPSLVQKLLSPMIFELLVGYFFVNIVLQNEGTAMPLTIAITL